MTAASARKSRGKTTAPSRFDLDGGALALLEASHDVPLVSFVVALRCGSAIDPRGNAGLARIAMRLLRRGCEGMTSEQIDFRIDALGAEMAVDTSHSTVAIHAQVIARNLDPFVDLVARMLSTPTFPEDELARLKRETIAEIVEALDNDRAVAQKAMQRTLFAGHPYGQSSGGTTASVQAITGDDVKTFYKRFVVKKNIVVGFSGDVIDRRALGLAGKLVAALPAGEAAPDDVPDPSVARGRRLLVVDKPERTQTQIVIGAMGTSAHDEDHVPLIVANAIFGGTFTSRLMKEIRSKRGWSYGTSARAGVDRRRHSWIMASFPAEKDSAPCLKLSLELLERWVGEGVTPREVAFIQRYLVRSHAFEVDTAAKRLHQALDVELLGLPADYFTGWIERVRAVTPETASAAVKHRIDPESLLAVVVATAPRVKDSLASAMARLAETNVVAFDTP